MATDRMLVWSGISRIDNATPIIVLATYVPRIGTKSAGSKNAKTGEMIQTYILNADAYRIDHYGKRSEYLRNVPTARKSIGR